MAMYWAVHSPMPLAVFGHGSFSLVSAWGSFRAQPSWPVDDHSGVCELVTLCRTAYCGIFFACLLGNAGLLIVLPAGRS